LSLLLTALFVCVFLVALMAFVVSARYEVGRESQANGAVFVSVNHIKR